MSAPFTSIRHPVAIDPSSRGLAEESDFSEHVEQLVRQVLLTSPGERINRPDFGCGVRRLVFAPGGEVAAALARTAIYQALTRWLSNAISVHEVTVRAVETTLEIKVGYVIRARGERRYLNMQVTP
jgi:phage baseplate assembly protein W